MVNLSNKSILDSTEIIDLRRRVGLLLIDMKGIIYAKSDIILHQLKKYI
jgi:hypothetical protein